QTDVPDLGYNRPAPAKTADYKTSQYKPLGQIVQAGARQPEPVPGRIVPGEPIVPPMTRPVTPPGYSGTDPGAGATTGVFGPGGTYTGPAPRGTITAIPIQGLDSVVIRAEDLADLQIVLDIIKLIEQNSEGTQPRVEVIHLTHGDCNYIATT